MGTTALPRLGLSALLFFFSAVTMAQNAMTTEPADLYAGPDNGYPVVAQLDSNTPIQVMGCLDDWSWCDVSVEDTRGWMYSPDITYQYRGDYIPLYSYAPSLGIAIVPFSVDVYWGRYYHDRPWYGRREEWAHRAINHRRPPGPPPTAGPPPMPGHGDAPREATHGDSRPLHLGSVRPGEPPPPAHRDDEHRPDEHRPDEHRPDEHRPNEHRPDEHRPDEHRPALVPGPAAAPREQSHALPPAPTQPHVEPPHPASPSGRATGAPAPQHEERPRPPPPREEEHPH